MTIHRHPTTGFTIYTQRIAQLDATLVVSMHTSFTNATVYLAPGEAPKGVYGVVDAWYENLDGQTTKPVAMLQRRGYFDTIKRNGAPWSMHTTDGAEVPHTMSNPEWVNIGHLMLRLALALVDKAKATQPETSDREYNWATNEAPAPKLSPVQAHGMGVAMRHHVLVTWNGNTVLDGMATGTMAYGIMGQMAGNFIGRDVAPLPSLDRIVKAAKGDMIRWEHVDETGAAHVTVTCQR